MDYVDAHLEDEFAHPDAFLLPAGECPNVTPRSKAHANDPEWHKICQSGPKRDILGPIDKRAQFTNHQGGMITQGAFGFGKFKYIE